MLHSRPGWRHSLAIGLLTLCISGCGRKAAADIPPQDKPVEQVPSLTAAAVATVPSYGYEVVNTWPHDPQAFTQGLIYLKGILIESTGLNGKSSLRKVDLQTGHIRQELKLSSEFFAEGMTVLRDKIYQLTWQNQKGFVYDVETFARVAEFSYTGEGWGLTTDGESLILSDGTNKLRFVDPKTFEVIRTVAVLDHAGQPLTMLNELEYIHGEIFANVWQTPYVVRIDPATGKLLGVIDFSGLLPRADYTTGTDVLNGVAFDPAGGRIFVTGKNWPKLFEVRLKTK
jgi:glutamine cyclotransferase